MEAINIMIGKLARLGLVLFAFSAMASATTITFGSLSSPFGDCTPGCVDRYQQLFNHSNFSSAGYITQIELYYASPDLAGTFDFSLSTSTSTVAGGLSNTFANNIGADNQLFYAGSLVAPVSNIATFTGITPFYYDPTQGDLLLDIQLVSGSAANSNSEYVSSAGTLFDRVYTFGPSSTGFGSQNYGNVTTFVEGPGPAPVPEPGSLGLLGSSLLGLAGALRKRLRK